jgi:hypothetical protein
MIVVKDTLLYFAKRIGLYSTTYAFVNIWNCDAIIWSLVWIKRATWFENGSFGQEQSNCDTTKMAVRFFKAQLS